MRRSIVDTIKGFFLSLKFNCAKEPVHARVENARMSYTRLKALKPVDPTNDPPKLKESTSLLSATGAEQNLNDPKSFSRRIRTNADMSHYRLQAYEATLPTPDNDSADEFEYAQLNQLTAAG